MNTLLADIERAERKHIEYMDVLIRDYFLSRTYKAVESLGAKCPKKHICVNLGGMGSNMSLFIHKSDKSLINLDIIDLEPSNNSRLDALLSELITLQNEFNVIMNLGFYPDLGKVVYNPNTKLVSIKES